MVGNDRREVGGKNGVAARTSGAEEHSNDESVDAEHTSHNNGDDGLHDHFVVHDTHRCYADTGLCGTVGSAQA